MKARYKFEEELIREYGDELEPYNEGYNIDDLNVEDRAFVGGVLWALNQVETSRLNYGECEDDNETIIGKLKEEIVSGFCEGLKIDLISEVHGLTLSCLDGYEEEGDENVGSK